MATGRTTGAALLTDRDREVIELAEVINKTIVDHIADEGAQKHFWSTYGKVHYSRDAGTGVAAGKLQRDALCTRGRQGKAPYSNRNLRWHPLVVADKELSYAKVVDGVEIEGGKTLVFVIKGKKYYPEQVYTLVDRYAVLPEHWAPHILTLKSWSDSDWTANSCIIPVAEAADSSQALETVVVLGLSLASAVYGVDKLNALIGDILSLLKKRKTSVGLKLPSDALMKILKKPDEFLLCPLCKKPLGAPPAGLSIRKRGGIWQPAWRKTKRLEGEDSSTQLLHMQPLIEEEIRHKPEFVRYGHRWCNVSMTDHSIEETVEFMKHIVSAHR